MRIASIIIFLWCLRASAATYFVATNGNDAASGTSAGAAWQHVQHGLTNLSAGDSLKLTSGQSFPELGLWSTASGSAASPILVTTTGAGKATIAATNGCGFYLTNCSWFTLDNLEIIGNPTNRANVDETPVATNSAGVLYVIPNISGSTNFTVQNCNIHLFGVGVHVWASNTSTNLNALVTSNYIHDISYCGIIFKQNQSAGFITNPICSYNTISNVFGDEGGGGGIFFSRTYGPSAQANLLDKIQNGPTKPSVGIEYDFSANAVARANEITEVRRVGAVTTDAIGIDFDMGTDHELAEFNYIYNCDGAGIQSYLSRTNITLRFNVIVGCGANSTSLGQIFISNPAVTNVGINIYNNTLISLSNTVPGIVLGQQTYLPITNIWANNIIVTSNAPSIYTYSISTNLGLYRNSYYDLGAAASFVWNGTTYSTWGAFTNATGQELGTGITNNPALVSYGIVTNGSALTIGLISNYKPQSGSPVVSAGADLASVFGLTLPSTDFAGSTLPASGYSIGAYNNPYVPPPVPGVSIGTLTVQQLRFQ